MPAEILTSLPTCITAGDTVRMLLSYEDYPASEWELSVSIKSVNGVFTKEAVAVLDSFSVVITSGESGAITPGSQSIAAIVSEIIGGDTVAVERENLLVHPNPASGAKGPRRIAYEAALANLDALAAKKTSSVSFNNQSFTIHNIRQLDMMVQRMKTEAMDEDRERGLSVKGGLVRIQSYL